MKIPKNILNLPISSSMKNELFQYLEKTGNNIDFRILLKFINIHKENFSIEKLDKWIVCKDKFKNLGYKASRLYYIPEYLAAFYSVSLEEGEKLVNNFKDKKSTKLSKFIERHGEDEGLKKFKKFQITSNSTGKIAFQKKYGDDWERYYIESCASISKRSIGYWMKRGYSKEDSILLVSHHQLKHSGVHRQYWITQGFSEIEVDKIMCEINSKKACHSRNMDFLHKKYGESWFNIYQTSIKKYRKRMEAIGAWIEEDKLYEFKKYTDLVNWYTNISIKIHKDKIENLYLRGYKYHLDHKISIKAGFINEILPEMIGSYLNLEIIPANKNCSKKEKSSMKIEDLISLYNSRDCYEKNN